MSTRTATESQLRFITSLLEARKAVLELDDIDAFVAEQKYAELTTKAASALIDQLKQIPTYVVDTTTGEIAAPSYRSNAYGGTCRTCGQYVEPQTGRIEKSGSQWLTFHLDGECPVREAEVVTYDSPEGIQREAAAPKFVLTPGIYEVNGVVVKVVRSQAMRLYGKALTARLNGTWSDGTDRYDASWDYSPGLSRQITSEDQRLSAEAAAEYGALYGICVACGRGLNDERSVVAGYGATCAANNGWSYPSKAEATARITPEQALRVAELRVRAAS